MKTSARF